MNVQQVFDLSLKLGTLADPRGAKGVKKYLDRVKKEYENLSAQDKSYFDTENLTNPYPDTRIHVNDGKTEVKRVMAGIDIGSGEILLASQLGERGKKIDLVIAHHPEGMALINLHEVMEMGIDMSIAHGVPTHIAQKVMDERAQEVGRNIHPGNHTQVVTIAELLKINFINTHTSTDNLVDEYVRTYITQAKPETLGDIMDALMEIPEFVEAKKMGAGPKIFAGTPNHRVGKFLVEMTGGTEPGMKIYEELSRAGISTMVSMHMRKDTLEKASGAMMNVVCTGHMSSDSLGMNLFLDELEKKGIEIVPVGGLIRVSRAAKKAKKTIKQKIKSN